MSLSGQQLKDLQKALISAFIDKTALEQMLLFQLNKNLREIAGEGSLKDIIFKLIQTADAEGWIEGLVLAASAYNPGNLELRAIAENLLSTPEKYPLGKNDRNRKKWILISVVGTTVSISLYHIIINEMEKLVNPTVSSAISTSNHFPLVNPSTNITPSPTVSSTISTSNSFPSVNHSRYVSPAEKLGGTKWGFQGKSGSTIVEFLKDKSVKFTDNYYGTQGSWESQGRDMISFNTDKFSFRGRLTTDERGMGVNFTELDNTSLGKQSPVNYLTLYKISQGNI